VSGAGFATSAAEILRLELRLELELGRPGTVGRGGGCCEHGWVTASEIIELLRLEPHPEGGHYAETWRGPDGPDERSTATLIYFLLQAGERSHWHRVDAAETWCWHAGAPLRLRIDDWEVALGPDLLAGERPHAVVPAESWQAAETTGDFTLVSCVVAPGFEFDGFQLAPPGWSYGQPNPGSG